MPVAAGAAAAGMVGQAAVVAGRAAVEAIEAVKAALMVVAAAKAAAAATAAAVVPVGTAREHDSYTRTPRRRPTDSEADPQTALRTNYIERGRCKSQTVTDTRLRHTGKGRRLSRGLRAVTVGGRIGKLV